MFLGWYFDVIIGYVIRALVRFFQMQRGKAWPIEKATISSITCEGMAYGGPYVDLVYTYNRDGEYYSGLHRKGFMSTSSAKEYVARSIVGGQIPIHVNPMQPETSIIAGDN
jgi:hypothetical protein